MGLLILRLTISTLALTMATGQLAEGLTAVVSLGVCALSILIAIGLFTSICAPVGALLGAGLAFVLRDATYIVVAAVLCASLAMTGPGAYSMDTLLFGQRRITFPDQQ